MDSIYRPFIENKEIIEGLKDHINEAQKLKKNVCDSGVSLDYESLEFLKNASDEQKAEISQLSGMSFNDYLLYLDYLVFFLDYYMPLDHAIIYLGICDLFELIKNNDVDDLPIVELPDWEQVFISLCKIPSHIINYCITQLDCNNVQKTNILKAITEKESVSFYECVSQMGNESYLLARIAYQYDFFLNSENPINFVKEKSPQKLLMINDSMSEMAKQSTEAEQTIRKSTELWTLKEENPDISASEIGSMISFDEFKAVYINYMNEYLSNQNIYLDNRNRYSKEIQDIVDPYVVDPEKIDFYVELKKRGCTFDAIEDNGVNKQETIIEDYPEPNTDIFLPNDFFHIQNRKSEKSIGILKIIFIQCDEAIKKYCELINHLAKHGYIGDSQDVKRNLAYKLSGYYIEYNADSIEWHGETNILSVLISRMVEHGQKWKNAKKAFVFDKDVRLYNSSSLRNDNSYDLQFAELFKRLYSIDLYK